MTICHTQNLMGGGEYQYKCSLPDSIRLSSQDQVVHPSAVSNGSDGYIAPYGE